MVSCGCPVRRAPQRTCDSAWKTSSKLSQGMCSHSGHAFSAAYKRGTMCVSSRCGQLQIHKLSPHLAVAAVIIESTT